MAKKKKGTFKFLAGALAGAGLGVLFSPKSSKEAREDVKKLLDELVDKSKDIDSKDVKKKLETKIQKLKKELEDLDKEKAKDIAEKKAKDIAKTASELVDLAVEKGTPALEKAASAIKSKAVVAAKDMIKKIEQEEK